MHIHIHSIKTFIGYDKKKKKVLNAEIVTCASNFNDFCRTFQSFGAAKPKAERP